MKRFQSEYFDTVEELMAAKTTMETDGHQKVRRRRIIRQFSNGLATMSAEEAQTLGQTEIVNHLTTFKHLSQRKKRLEQTFTTTRVFVEIKVDTDRPEQDALATLRLTSPFNKFCLYDGTEFATFVKSAAGEIQISGGMPVMLQDKGGWAPKLATNMLFPKGCGLAACDVPYAMAPKQYSLSELEGLLKQVNASGEKNTSKKAIEELIRVLKKKPKGESVQTGGSNIVPKQSENVGSVIDEPTSDRNATVNAWWFYEVKTNDAGEQHVSGTFFTEDIDLGKAGDGTGPQVLAYFEKLFASPKDWLHLISMDMEIGGDVTWDSVRGLAEIMFPSASEMEILLNLIIQGDKERARPKYQVGTDAVLDQALSWDPENSPWVPPGINSFDMKGSSAPLLTPFQMLMSNAAGLASGTVTNGPGGSGELLRQQQERAQNNSVMNLGDMSDWTCQLEQLAYAMVERVFIGTVRQGAKGFHQIMAVRACVEKYGLNINELFKKEHGRLKYITVRVRRVMGDGGLDTEQTSAKFLMDMAPKLSPQGRQKIYQRAIAFVTQDPDLAEDLVTISQPIINAQKLDAENECDTIFRLAALGMPVTTKPGDIDQDHLPVHMLGMVAKLSKHQMRPWDKLDVLEFSGLQRHAQDHLENMLMNPDSHEEALAFIPQMQEIVQAAAAIVALVEEKEGQAQQQMTPVERENLDLKWAAEHRKGVELGANIEDKKSLAMSRNIRQAQVSRTGYVREIESGARFELERRRSAAQQAMEKQRTDAQVAKMEKETAEPAASG